jgi:molybdate transport system ATP-binding protein
MSGALELRGLRARQGNFELAVDLVLHGVVTGIFGASGAGKTTLLEIIAGLRQPSVGTIRLDGAVLFDAAEKIFRPARARRIGYVPQDLALFPHLRVEANIDYGRHRAAAGEPAIRREAVCRVLEIEGLLTRFPGELSGGEQQRVAFARALLSSPALLLFDEPLAHLDRELKERVIPYLVRVRDEFRVPILYVTHAADEIVALCRDTIVLESGKVVAQGAPEQLFARTDLPVYRLRSEIGRGTT